jgi:hypothetical protein
MKRKRVEINLIFSSSRVESRFLCSFFRLQSRADNGKFRLFYLFLRCKSSRLSTRPQKVIKVRIANVKNGSIKLQYRRWKFQLSSTRTASQEFLSIWVKPGESFSAFNKFAAPILRPIITSSVTPVDWIQFEIVMSGNIREIVCTKGKTRRDSSRFSSLRPRGEHSPRFSINFHFSSANSITSRRVKSVSRVGIRSSVIPFPLGDAGWLADLAAHKDKLLRMPKIKLPYRMVMISKINVIESKRSFAANIR